MVLNFSFLTVHWSTQLPVPLFFLPSFHLFTHPSTYPLSIHIPTHPFTIHPSTMLGSLDTKMSKTASQSWQPLLYSVLQHTTITRNIQLREKQTTLGKGKNPGKYPLLPNTRMNQCPFCVIIPRLMPTVVTVLHRGVSRLQTSWHPQTLSGFWGPHLIRGKRTECGARNYSWQGTSCFCFFTVFFSILAWNVVAINESWTWSPLLKNHPFHYLQAEKTMRAAVTKFTLSLHFNP